MSYKDEDLEKINVPDYTLRHNELPEDLLHKVIIGRVVLITISCKRGH